MRVIVIGAGIVGASIAYHLAERDASVTLIEGRKPGSGASGATFACLNVFSSQCEQLLQLRLRSIRYLRELAERLHCSALVHQCGTLRWTDETNGKADFAVKTQLLRDSDLTCDSFSPSYAQAHLEPDIEFGCLTDEIVRISEEGWLDSVPFIARLLSAGRDSKNLTICHTTVEHITVSASTARAHTPLGELKADRIVVACGAESIPLCRDIGPNLPLEMHPGVTLAVTASTGLLRHVIYTGDLHFRPGRAGSLVAGLGGEHRAAPLPSEKETRQTAQQIAERLAKWMPAHRPASPGDARVGVRTIWPDGYPVVGWLPEAPRIYLATYHSGITLAPILGSLCADEITFDLENSDLSLCRPDRFLAHELEVRGVSHHASSH